MRQMISYLRVTEWLDSKVTFMIGVLLIFLFSEDSPFEEILIKTSIFFLYSSMFLAFSYVANDFSDIEVDKKAGKKKVIANMPQWSIWVSLIVMVIIGNTPIILYVEKKLLCILLILFTYILGLAYSTLGIRFKERGVWGLIECSFAQRSMPLLMLFFLVRNDKLTVISILGWIILSFIIGLRYIVIHQVKDMDNDLATGVNTYVTQKHMNYRKVMIIMLGFEVVLLLALLIPLWLNETVLILVFFILNIALEYCIYMVIQVYAKKDFFLTFDSVPMEAFYNTLLPVLLAISLSLRDIKALVILLFLALICIRSFVVKIQIALVYIKSKWVKRR